MPNSCSQTAIALVFKIALALQECKAKLSWRPVHRRADSTLIKVLNYHWVLLGPANIFKVSYVNKPSPAAKYVVVPPAETIARRDSFLGARCGRAFSGALQTIPRRSPRRSCKIKYPTKPRRRRSSTSGWRSSSPLRRTLFASRSRAPAASRSYAGCCSSCARARRVSGRRRAVGSGAPPK